MFPTFPRAEKRDLGRHTCVGRLGAEDTTPFSRNVQHNRCRLEASSIISLFGTIFLSAVTVCSV